MQRKFLEGLLYILIILLFTLAGILYLYDEDDRPSRRHFFITMSILLFIYNIYYIIFNKLITSSSKSDSSKCPNLYEAAQELSRYASDLEASRRVSGLGQPRVLSGDSDMRAYIDNPSALPLD